MLLVQRAVTGDIDDRVQAKRREPGFQVLPQLFDLGPQRLFLSRGDPGGAIEPLLRRRRAIEQLKEVKTDLLRQQRMVGVVATRPARARYVYNTVFRVDALVSSNVVGFLNSIGLI